MATLISLDDVRAYIGKPPEETAQDAVLGGLITAASAAIERWCCREFSQTDGATRRFEVERCFAHLSPYDLRAATTVTLNPDGASPATLVEGTDYRLEPIPQRDGTYLWVRLATVPPATALGPPVLEIEGDWGMASMPADVAQACRMQVRAWYGRDVAVYSEEFDEQASPTSPHAKGLETGVKRVLAPYRRPGIA